MPLSAGADYCTTKVQACQELFLNSFWDFPEVPDSFARIPDKKPFVKREIRFFSKIFAVILHAGRDRFRGPSEQRGVIHKIL